MPSPVHSRWPSARSAPAAGGIRRQDPRLVNAVDALLEASVIGSFSVLGCRVRRRIERWEPPPRMDGKVVVVTGASSGIGRAAAIGLARRGAEVWLAGREEARLVDVAHLAEQLGATAHVSAFDVTDAPLVADFAHRVARSHERVDGVIHAAGALLRSFERSPDGTERTVATHLLAPFRLTWLLSPLLRESGRATVVTLSSGGMYAEPFDLRRLEMTREDYDGVRAYARAKRAQVVLSHEWSRRLRGDGVVVYAVHPGWVDTPGLASGLPAFRHLRCLLRTPAEGADTAVWLTAQGARWEAAAVGQPAPRDVFWHDRRPRAEYRFPGPRRPEKTDDGGTELWEWCADRTGVGHIDDGEPSAP